MILLLGAFTIGLILSLLALGIYISYRVFDIADITADGSITLGTVDLRVLIVRGVNPLVATLGGFAGGLAAGTVTGILQAKFKINALLSGILVMTSLYSVNLHVMGKSNVPLLSGTSFTTWAERLGQTCFGQPEVHVYGLARERAGSGDAAGHLGMIVVVGLGLYWFFRTELGTAMRAAGDNPQMIRSPGRSRGTLPHHGTGLVQRPDGPLRGVAGPIPGFRRRPDGHRHGGLGTGQRDHR